MNEKIADRIKEDDFSGYQKERYPEIQDGEELIFENEDFSNVNFDNFSMGFTTFRYCNLDGANHLYGQPITLNNCSARGIDFRGISAVFIANDTDFSGMLFDENTNISKDDGNGIYSIFIHCKLDLSAKKFFEQHGAKIS